MTYEYLSQERYDELIKQLEQLKTEERHKVSKAIAEAREKGDLSENAEYDAAKEAQGLLELKINELSAGMANARVLDTSELDSSKATIFANVKIKNLKNKKVYVYKLVSELEANLKEKKISVTSPIGKGLLGKEVGQLVEIQTPRAVLNFEVLEIFF